MQKWFAEFTPGTIILRFLLHSLKSLTNPVFPSKIIVDPSIFIKS